MKKIFGVLTIVLALSSISMAFNTNDGIFKNRKKKAKAKMECCKKDSTQCTKMETSSCCKKKL